jgi:hypothetical protein
MDAPRPEGRSGRRRGEEDTTRASRKPKRMLKAS